MTVTTDSKKRVRLGFADPGDRFDVQVSPDGTQVTMKLLVPAEPRDAALVKLVRSPEGFLMLSEADAARVNKDDIRKALRADRDAA